jgi:hypothetical protein
MGDIDNLIVELKSIVPGQIVSPITLFKHIITVIVDLDKRLKTLERSDNG